MQRKHNQSQQRVKGEVTAQTRKNANSLWARFIEKAGSLQRAPGFFQRCFVTQSDPIGSGGKNQRAR